MDSSWADIQSGIAVFLFIQIVKKIIGYRATEFFCTIKHISGSAIKMFVPFHFSDYIVPEQEPFFCIIKCEARNPKPISPLHVIVKKRPIGK